MNNAFTAAVAACRLHGAMQRVDELAAVLELVDDLRPRVVVEIGCMNGGTLFAWRQVCDRVYAITLPNKDSSYPRPHGAVVHFGDSHDPASVQWLLAELGGDPVDVLAVDGDHSYEGVAADYRMYAPLVRDGGLVLLHDIAETFDKNNEVPRFWAEIGQGGKEIVSNGPHPIGWGVLVHERSDR